jgi:hypothetical protein
MIRLLILFGLFLLLPHAAHAQTSGRFFPETGYSVAGRFLSFWEANGGLESFGYPLGPARRERGADGQWREIQRFERARMELHPDNTAPYDVLLGRLGVEHLRDRGIDWQALPTTKIAGPGCQRFASGHQICGRIRATWSRRGLAIYGLPISDLLREPGADGQTRLVQYFERARMELHPGNAPPYDLLLGHLERERITGRGPVGKPQPQPYYFFPVQPAARVSYGRDHHDYPATDIFAPSGSDFVAPTSGLIEYVSRQDRWSPQTDRGEDRGGLAVSIVGDDGIRYYYVELAVLSRVRQLKSLAEGAYLN